MRGENEALVRSLNESKLLLETRIQKGGVIPPIGGSVKFSEAERRQMSESPDDQARKSARDIVSIEAFLHWALGECLLPEQEVREFKRRVLTEPLHDARCAFSSASWEQMGRWKKEHRAEIPGGFVKL